MIKNSYLPKHDKICKKDVEELKSQKAFSGKGLKSFEDFGLVSKVKRFL